MGFFSKLLGGSDDTEKYAPLDPASDAARHIDKFRLQFSGFKQKAKDRCELIPSDKVLYIFVGKPPDTFGIVWFAEGDAEGHNLKTLMSKKGLSQKQVDNIVIKLREAYTQMEKETRYSVEIDGEKTTVLPNEAFSQTLYNILHIMDE